MIRQYKKYLFLNLFSLIFLFKSTVWSAACCGGGFAIPSIITGDDLAQFTTSFSVGQIDTDVFSSGIWQKRSVDDLTQNLRLDIAHVFYDRWQLGASTSLIKRARSSSESSGLGDTQLLVGYEALPDWDYHPWRPKGVIFLTFTLPTGKSIFESTDFYALDARGRGFASIGLGSVFTKTFSRWDGNLSLEVHRSFEKSVSNQTLQGKLVPAYGGVLSLGLGYSILDFRLGAGLAWNYEDPIQTQGNISSIGSLQRFATGSLLLSYMWNKEWATSLSYSDQTLFGSPLNAQLSKTFLLSMQKRWER